MKKTALVIMAAGIGSRFGGGIKQLEPLGPNGEVIMEYSIHDALEAGFNKVVFIIRKEMEDYFKEVVGDKISGICEVAYAYQNIGDLPAGFTNPEGRTKPWGTGQAILACKGIVNEPFLRSLLRLINLLPLVLTVICLLHGGYSAFKTVVSSCLNHLIV